MAAAARRYLREGLTSVTEAGIGGGWVGHSPVELAAYAAAREQGRLPVRVELMVVSDAFHPLAAHPSDGIEAGIDLGLRTGFGDDWLRLGPMKIFTDGSLVGRTAAMSAPVRGRRRATAATCRPTPASSPPRSSPRTGRAGGSPRTRSATARSTWPSTRSTRRRRPVPAARPAAPDRALRRRPSRPGGPGRRARRDPVGQGRFATEIGDGMLAAVGPARHAWLYRQRSLLDAGLVLPGSSDRPVVAGAPLLGLHDMVNRRTAAGVPFNAAEAVTAAEALRAYTWGSAYASKAEHVKGSIEPGKLADFTVLSEDPTAVGPGPHRGPRGDRDDRRRRAALLVPRLAPARPSRRQRRSPGPGRGRRRELGSIEVPNSRREPVLRDNSKKRAPLAPGSLA